MAMSTIVVWAHGSLTCQRRAIPINGFRIVHPSLENWPVDAVATNIIKEMLATAETIEELRLARQRLEKLPSSETVDLSSPLLLEDRSVGGPYNLSRVLLEHRLSPALAHNSSQIAIYEPAEFETDYHEFFVCHDANMLGKLSLSIQLNKRKLFNQAIEADGPELVLGGNHAIFLSLTHVN